LNANNAIVNAATNCTFPYNSCPTPINEVISNQVAPQGVNPLSSLAACTLGLGYIRVFFQNGGNKVNQLTSESNWTSNAILDQETAPGSSLAVSFTQAQDMNVFYESSPSILSRITYSFSTNWISGKYYSPTLPKIPHAISEPLY
jgi:hypothetical protein